MAFRAFLVDIGTAFGAVRCVMSRAAAGAPITIHVEANALRHLHNRRSDFNGERAHANGADNWLHPDDVTRTNETVRSITSQMYEVAAGSAWHLASLIVAGLPGQHDCAPLHSTILELELVLDLATPSPALLFEMIAARITRMASRVVEREYVTRPAVYRELNRHARMISGDLRGPNYRIKAYDKTTRRVRIEVTLNSEGARVLGLRLSLDDRTILEVLDEVARLVLPQVRRVAAPLPAVITNGVRPIQAVAAFTGATNDLPAAIAAIEAAALTGRLTTPTFKRAFLKRLLDAGVLEGGKLGVFFITPSYRDALRFLGLGSADLSGSIHGGGA